MIFKDDLRRRFSKENDHKIDLKMRSCSLVAQVLEYSWHWGGSSETGLSKTYLKVRSCSLVAQVLE